MGLLDYLPQPPWEGPPLPRALEQRWPWFDFEEEVGIKLNFEREDPIVPTEAIVALHKEGLSPSEIAARLGTTYDAVYMRLIRSGLTPHPAPPPLISTEDIVALHKENLPAIEIAARLNVMPELIRYRLRRAGEEPIVAPKFLKAAERTQDIIRLHQEGQTPKQIAESLGLDWTLVHRRLRDAELMPHPSPRETRNTLQRLDEIMTLAKQDIPRQEIAKRTGSTWPLVAEALDKSSVRPVLPACEEIASWASTLLPTIDEIRKTRPDTKPALRKVDRLEKDLTSIADATWTATQRLPWKGKKADEERWCLGDIKHAVSTSLEAMDALKGSIKLLDVEKLPKRIEQARTSIENLANIMSGAVCRLKPE